MNRAEDERIEEIASDWFVRRRDGLSPEVEARYQAWLAVDPRHAAAIARLSATWEFVSSPALAGYSPEAARQPDRGAAWRRRTGVLTLSGLFAAAAAWFFVFSPLPPAPSTPTPAVALAARPRLERLPDGSLAELDATGEIAVEFSSNARAIRLLRGRGHFTVMKDPARPFIVSAGGVNVRAVGTIFAVCFTADEVGVVVTEGRVAVAEPASVSPAAAPVSSSAAAAEPLLLSAGQGAIIALPTADEPAAPIQPMPSAQVAGALAWRDKRVEFTRVPLSAVADFFNRQNQTQLTLTDPALASLPISGIFWSDDPEAFARLLESGMAIRAQRSGDTLVLRRR